MNAARNGIDAFKPKALYFFFGHPRGRMSTFRRSLPVVGTSFINKSGAIGLSLIPILLVEQKVSVHNSSFVLGLIKAFLVIGTFVGGLLADRWSARNITLTSFLTSATGLIGLSIFRSVEGIAIFGTIAQFGNALFLSSVRLLLVQVVPLTERQEAIGWLRAGNNFGNIFAYSLGSIAAFLGTGFLMVVDGLTSIVAFVVGSKWLPRVPRVASKGASAEKKWNWNELQLYWIFVAVLTCFNFGYEIFIISSAAKLRVIYHEEGLRIYSIAMVINTVLCTLLAVPASRWLKRPSLVFPFAFIAQAVGAIIAFQYMHYYAGIFIGMFLLTIGEVTFGSMAQFVLLQTLSDVKNGGFWYGVAMTVQSCGRIVSGVLAFPLLVYGSFHVVLFSLATVIPVILFSLRRQQFEKLVRTNIDIGPVPSSGLTKTPVQST